MADYYPVLKRAISSLPAASGDARRVVYEKARAALLKQLQSYDPPLSPEEVTEQRLALEECIRRIEGEVAGAAYGLEPEIARPAPSVSAPPPRPAPEARVEPPVEPRAPEPPKPEPARPEPVRAEPRVDLAKPEPSPAPRAEPPKPEPRPAPRAEPRMPPAAPLPPRPAAPRAEPARPAAAAVRPEPRPDAKIGAGISALSQTLRQADALGGASAQAVRTARGAIEDEAELPSSDEKIEPGFLEVPLGRSPAEPARPRPLDGPKPIDTDTGLEGPRRPAPRRAAAPSRGPRVATIAAAILVLLAVGAAGTYAWRTFVAGGDEATPPPAPAETAGAPASGDGLEPKILDRLPQDGEGAVVAPDARRVATVEVPPPADADFPPPAGEPAAEPPAAAPERAAPAAEAPPAAPEPAAEPPAAVAAAPATEQPAPPAPAAPAISATQRAILYEEPIPGVNGSRMEGRVTWSLVNEPVLPGEPAVPQLRAVVDVPDRQMSMTLSIRENADAALPASHVVEVKFTLPPNFDGRGIDTTPGLILKQTEDARGDPLIGAVAKVADNLFWVALSGSDPDEAKNVALLGERQWIDVPIRYQNRRRAILTFEKGAAGEEIVRRALATWAQ